MNSIKFRLLAFGIIMSVLPLMLLGIYSMRAARSDLENSINKNHVMAAVRVANDTTALVQTLRTSLETMAIAETDRLLGNFAPVRERLLYAIMNRYVYIEELAVVNREGQELTRVSRRYAVGPNDLRNVKERPGFEEAMQGKSYVGAARLEPDNQVVFTLAVPLVGVAGRTGQGSLIAQVSLRTVMERIASLPPGGGHVFLVDERGLLIGHEDFGQVVRGQDVRKSLSVQELMSGTETAATPVPSRYISYSGQEVLGVYMRVAGTGWGVVIEEPTALAYSSLGELIIKLAAAMVIAIALAVAVSIFFALIFIRSLDALAEGVRRVTRGDLEYSIPRQGDDEIGQVVDAFNGMTSELRRRREMEVAMFQAEKMAAVGMLAAGVAHEINNPMNTLSFYTTDLLERLPAEGATKLEEAGEFEYYLQTMQHQIVRCTSITSSLLNFARPQANRDDCIHLEQLLAEMLPLIRHRLRKQQVELTTDFPAHLPGVTANASQMQQVLLNLMTNALDAMPQGGQLHLSGEVANSQGEAVLRLRVTDTGHGIPAAILPQIFQPFFTTKPAGQGTGLGLSICYGIVSLLGGRIVAENQAGQGASIVMELPLERSNNND